MATTGLMGPAFSIRDSTTSSTMTASHADLASFVGSALFAGFAGVELRGAGHGQSRDVVATHRILDGSRVALSSVVVSAHWRASSESESERVTATRAIEFAKSFPGAKLVLHHVPGVDRRDLRERQDNAVSCVNEVARRASAEGVRVTFHPSSGPGSVFDREPDYDRFFSGTRADRVGYTPDLSELAHSQMDALDVIHSYRDRIDHVLLGARSEPISARADGDVERARVVAYLCHTGFTGWFVVDAGPTPDRTASAEEIQAAGRYAKVGLWPIVQEARRARGSS